VESLESQSPGNTSKEEDNHEQNQSCDDQQTRKYAESDVSGDDGNRAIEIFVCEVFTIDVFVAVIVVVDVVDVSSVGIFNFDPLSVG